MLGYHKLRCLSGYSNQRKKTGLCSHCTRSPKEKGPTRMPTFTKCRYWTDLIFLFLPLFWIAHIEKTKSKLAARIQTGSPFTSTLSKIEACHFEVRPMLTN